MAANWVDASTDEYWGGWQPWPNNTSFNYLGGGIWGGSSGPRERLNEQETSPFVGDPYEYIDGTQMFGIRFYASIDRSVYENWPGWKTTATIKTTANRTFSIEIDDVLNAVNTYFFEFEFDPISSTERVNVIEIDGSFGTDYGDDPLLYDIQIKTEADEPPSCRWTSFVGSIEVCE
jgi:hypothetical protein